MLDSYALLSYLKKEDNHEKVVELLVHSRGDRLLLMNEINVGECYYIVARRIGHKEADYLIETILPSLPIQIVSNGFEDVLAAARIKAAKAISFSDCFAVATAVREKAAVVTGDPEFKKVKDVVDVEWL
ncbi:MAG: type II toxin-antitoxin system VapC family toxin [Deltaproteobacteria bacterium]|nr:type II toxin-antitoxin system VapC family toxin [Deltaproteobacteria bacterium]